MATDRRRERNIVFALVEGGSQDAGVSPPTRGERPTNIQSGCASCWRWRVGAATSVIIGPLSRALHTEVRTIFRCRADCRGARQGEWPIALDVDEPQTVGPTGSSIHRCMPSTRATCRHRFRHRDDIRRGRFLEAYKGASLPGHQPKPYAGGRRCETAAHRHPAPRTKASSDGHGNRC